MKNQIREYTVYKHTAPNGKVYIGITCKKPEHRWNHGRGYKNCRIFYNAISKYGWGNISEAAEIYCRTSLRDVLRGKYKTHRGYIWKYESEKIKWQKNKGW